MKFTEIRLINFGQYSGEHVLTLDSATSNTYSTTQPITLIGGRNGAGKTTILEAVKLCLYGSAILGYNAKPADYRRYLKSRIHRYPGHPFRHEFAGVAVQFQHTVTGIAHTFDVQRVWQRKGRSVDETLIVRRDDVPLKQHEYGWWEQFLHDLLPPGLAELFFFDGEKIQALADDPDYTELGRSIRALLGLELLDRLRADLAIYVSRQTRKGEKGLEAQLESLSKERSMVEAQFAEAFSTLATTNRLLEHKHGKIEELERLLASEGGDIAHQREVLKYRAKELEEEINRCDRAVAEQASSLLPFAIIPALCRSLGERLVKEEKLAQELATQEAANSIVNAVLTQIRIDNTWLSDMSLNDDQQTRLFDELASTIQQVSRTTQNTVHTQDDLLHDLSKQERREILTWLDEAVDVTPQRMSEIGIRLEQASEELARIQERLLAEPDEEVIGPILRQLAELNQEIGVLATDQATQNEVVHLLRLKRIEFDRREEDLYKRVMRGDDPEQRIVLAKKAQQAIERYERELLAAKVHVLEQSLVESLNKLGRKENFVKRVQINPKSFETKLFNTKGDLIPKDQLSAGEKQVYAVALLWALRIVSGRQVPIIIDTPLGRLDGEHRERLTKHYFPYASHQVILLSTDTEVDEELYHELRPSVARTYRLRYRPQDSSTQIVDGFFWDESEIITDERLRIL